MTVSTLASSDAPAPSSVVARANGQRAARFLKAALIGTFVLHGLAAMSMALCLLPGLPGGLNEALEDRARFVAGHPWWWRAGWLFCQLAALSDVLLGVALLRTRWVPKLPAVVTLGVTLAAVGTDLAGQGLWVTRGVALAQDAVARGDFSTYAAFESRTFRVVAGVATVGYVLVALGWTWCFVAAGTWSRRLTWLSVAAWGTFSFAAIAVFLPPRLHPGPALVAAAGALGFVLLMIWLADVGRLVWRRGRTLPPSHGS